MNAVADSVFISLTAPISMGVSYAITNGTALVSRVLDCTTGPITVLSFGAPSLGSSITKICVFVSSSVAT